MKTLHAIQTEPTLLDYLTQRFRGTHDDWHYRSNEIWYTPYVGAQHHHQVGLGNQIGRASCRERVSECV